MPKTTKIAKPAKTTDKGAKKTQTKKAKDPNAPKKSMSSYMFYCAKKREEVKKDFPELKGPGVMKKLAELWGAATADDKKAYDEMAKKDKERYAKEKEEYAKANEHEE